MLVAAVEVVPDSGVDLAEEVEEGEDVKQDFEHQHGNSPFLNGGLCLADLFSCPLSVLYAGRSSLYLLLENDFSSCILPQAVV